MYEPKIKLTVLDGESRSDSAIFLIGRVYIIMFFIDQLTILNG